MLAACLVSLLALTDSSGGHILVNACNIAVMSQGSDYCYISTVGRGGLQVRENCDVVQTRMTNVGRGEKAQ